MTKTLHRQPQSPVPTSLDLPRLLADDSGLGRTTSLRFCGDPHIVPLFESQNLCESQTPVLYLPPLLSALPEGLASHRQTVISQNSPVVTETRLPDIDPASLSLHKALHHFMPVNSDYANTPYSEAFNWTDLVLPEEDAREWYCVVFLSKRRVGSDGGCSPFLSISFSSSDGIF
jgi:hypothetical protein